MMKALQKNKVKLTSEFTGRLDTLSTKEQVELAGILEATIGETHRQWAVETYLARRIVRVIHNKGEIVPLDLLAIARRTLHGDEERKTGWM